MVIFYSGYGCKYSDPERLLAPRANVMLTAFDSVAKNRPEKRFRGILRVRKKGRRARR